VKKDKITLPKFVINILVFFSILAIMFIALITIKNNIPKETLEDKLLIVLAYIIGFIVLYYFLNIIYGKYLANVLYGHVDPRSSCLFVWIAVSIVNIFKVVVGLEAEVTSPTQTQSIQQPEITKSLNSANTEGKIKILKANGLSKESVYDVLKNDYNFKILIKDGNSTFEKIYDDAATDAGE
jgi:hypothetical protein